MTDVVALHRTLEQELHALARGVSLECLVCGEFVLRRGTALSCPECCSVLAPRQAEAVDVSGRRLGCAG